MKIGFFIPFLYRYQRGIERSSVQLANTFAKLGHQVFIFTWAQTKPSANFTIDSRVRVMAVPDFRYYRSLFAVPFYMFFLLASGIDTAFVYFSSYGEAPSLKFYKKIRPGAKIKFIVGYPIELVPHKFAEFNNSGLGLLLDNIIVKSPGMAQGVSGFFQREVRVVPNGVDTTYFDPEFVDGESLRKKLNLTKNSKILLTVAALEERKGAQYIIQVLPELIQNGHDLYYVIVGDGPYRSNLQDFVRQLGLDSRVYFAGSVSDVRPYYKVADIFCLLSYGEGFPNVLLEAWAMGLPAIVSQHPPYPDIIQNNDLGICLPEKEVDVLAKNIERFLSLFSGTDVLDRKRRARSYVCDHYSLNQVVNNLLFGILSK
jgi:glycosyltransferase involved in cell wall biosynthesis